jgi:hypothetical protein
MLALTKENYKEVCSRYSGLLILSDDAEEALDFARDLLEAELSAMKKKNPTAVATIKALDAAVDQLLEVRNAISDDEFAKE